jgi:hypothetical protein
MWWFLTRHHIIQLEIGAAAFLEVLNPNRIKALLQWKHIGFRFPITVQSIIGNQLRVSQEQFRPIIRIQHENVIVVLLQAGQ